MTVNRTISSVIVIIFSLFAMSAVAAEEKASGTVTLEEVEVSFIGSVKAGGGTLTFKGKEYPFNIGGLGIGGIGISTIHAKGHVYRLKNVADFGGVYGGLRAGIVVVDIGLKGGLWMENTKGAVMHLVPEREGLALSMGVDGIVIEMER